MRDEQPDAEAVRFTALWEAYAGRVLAYASRHVGADVAQEVVSETFLIAWRRLADVPGQPLPWLLVVARNTVANHRRSTYRGAVLHGELVRLQQAAAPATGADVTATDRAQALSRLATLTSKEREALLLVSWDGLVPAEAAQVAGCSLAAFHVRLHRARRRLQAPLDPIPVDDPDASAPVEAVPVRRTATAAAPAPRQTLRTSLPASRTTR
jgi:RNA polymerase sigma-70 factor (ECF subfamily)